MINKSIYILLGFAFILLLPATIMAASTIVTVTVFDANGNPVNNASVSITCEGETLAGVSNNDNVYHRNFGNNKCDPGETVVVTVLGPNGETGSGQGVMGDTELNLVINLANAGSVPEFGLIPGLLAAGGSVLGYLKLRSRK